MSHFNDAMKLYVSHYTNTLGFADVVEAIESEKILDKGIAARLIEFSDVLIKQGIIDAENELILGTIDVDVYDIEKLCVAITSFVDDQGHGDLLNLG